MFKPLHPGEIVNDTLIDATLNRYLYNNLI
jgi:plasmid maintenance system antidote protein VapI